MAPGLVDHTPAWLEDGPVDKDVFPDGYKSSGQLDPIYSLIRPYEEFPKEITGPTVWKAEDYKDNAEKWTHTFTADEIAELGAAADAFIEAGHPLTGMTKVSTILSPYTYPGRILFFLMPETRTASNCRF